MAAFFAVVITPYCIFSQTAAPGTAAPLPATPSAESAAASPETPEAAPETAAAGEAAPPDENAGRPGTAATRAQEEALDFFGEGGPGAAAGDAAAPRRPSSILAILRMILVLALVAGLIYFVVYLLRRMGKPQVEQNPHLKILASAHLGSGRYLHVVSVGKSAYLIGAGEGGVSHIADISDQEAVDAMSLDASQKSAETRPLFDFQALLNKFTGGISAKEQDRLENVRRNRKRFKRF